MIHVMLVQMIDLVHFLVIDKQALILCSLSMNINMIYLFTAIALSFALQSIEQHQLGRMRRKVSGTFYKWLGMTAKVMPQQSNRYDQGQ